MTVLAALRTSQALHTHFHLGKNCKGNNAKGNEMLNWIFGDWQTTEDRLREEARLQRAQDQHRKRILDMHNKQAEEFALNQGKEVWVKENGLGVGMPQEIYWTKDCKYVWEDGKYVMYRLKSPPIQKPKGETE